MFLLPLFPVTRSQEQRSFVFTVVGQQSNGPFFLLGPSQAPTTSSHGSLTQRYLCGAGFLSLLPRPHSVLLLREGRPAGRGIQFRHGPYQERRIGTATAVNILPTSLMMAMDILLSNYFVLAMFLSVQIHNIFYIFKQILI
uniref:Uncharacterized protein n=1 Tax=Arundo donax TaxID=35708 RepID=A0A0A9TVT0_ARUDO